MGARWSAQRRGEACRGDAFEEKTRGGWAIGTERERERKKKKSAATSPVPWFDAVRFGS